MPNPEKFKVVGLPIYFKLHGGGTLSFDAGKIVFDVNGNIIFQAGPHPLAENGFQLPQEVCFSVL